MIFVHERLKKKEHRESFLVTEMSSPKIPEEVLLGPVQSWVLSLSKKPTFSSRCTSNSQIQFPTSKKKCIQNLVLQIAPKKLQI